MRKMGGLRKRVRRKESQHTPVAARRTRCVNCNRVKVKCSDSLPCERCFHLCLSCVPASTGTSYPELAVAVLNIAEANETFMRTFERIYTAGLLDTGSIALVASAWRAESRRAGIDVTHGLLHMVTCAAKLASTEVTSPVVNVNHADAGLPKCGEAGAGCVCVPMVQRFCGGTSGLSMGPELKTEWAEEAFGVLSGEAAPRARLRESGIYAEDDGSRMMLTVAMTGEGLVVATNSAADELFCSATEMQTLMHRYGVLPMHVLASMIPSEERHLLYEAQVSVLCSQPRPYTAFLKLCERDGQVELYILQAHALNLPELPKARGLATIFTLERCPASRHVTTRPGHRHKVIERHRRGRHGRLKGQQLGSIRPPPTIPPFACLPLPPASRRHRQQADPPRSDYPSAWPPFPITTIEHHPQICLDNRRNGTLPFTTIIFGSDSHLSCDPHAPLSLGCGTHGCSGHDLGEGVDGYDREISGLARSTREGPDGPSGLRGTLSPLDSVSEASDLTGSTWESDESGEQWFEDFLKCWGSQQLAHLVKAPSPAASMPMGLWSV